MRLRNESPKGDHATSIYKSHAYALSDFYWSSPCRLMHRPPVRRGEFLQSLHKCQRLSARYQQAMLDQTRLSCSSEVCDEEFEASSDVLNLSRASGLALILSHDLRSYPWLRKCKSLHVYIAREKDSLHMARGLMQSMSIFSSSHSPECPASTTESLHISQQTTEKSFVGQFQSAPSKQSGPTELLPAIVLTGACEPREVSNLEIKLNRNNSPHLEANLISPNCTIDSQNNQLGKLPQPGSQHFTPKNTQAVSEHDNPLKTQLFSPTPLYKKPTSPEKDLLPVYLRQSTEPVKSRFIRRTVGSSELREASERLALDMGGTFAEHLGPKTSNAPQLITRKRKVVTNRQIHWPETEDEITICCIQEAVSRYTLLI